MCQKTVKMIVVMLFAVFIFAECAAGRSEIKKSRGSCLSYGHACWGAHGKRSGSPLSDNEATEWFLSRLMNPLDLRYLPSPKIDHPLDDAPTTLENEEDLGTKRGSTKWEQLREYLKNANPSPVEVPRNDERLRFLEKRSAHQTN